MSDRHHDLEDRLNAARETLDTWQLPAEKLDPELLRSLAPRRRRRWRLPAAFVAIGLLIFGLEFEREGNRVSVAVRLPFLEEDHTPTALDAQVAAIARHTTEEVLLRFAARTHEVNAAREERTREDKRALLHALDQALVDERKRVAEQMALWLDQIDVKNARNTDKTREAMAQLVSLVNNR